MQEATRIVVPSFFDRTKAFKTKTLDYSRQTWMSVYFVEMLKEIILEDFNLKQGDILHAF